MDEAEVLVGVLPSRFRPALTGLSLSTLTEIVMDIGRPPMARLDGRALLLHPELVSAEDLRHVTERIGEFTADNRAGIACTLHRISALRNRQGHIVGLTLRVGRAVHGTIDILRDLLESGRNVLILGRPGIGKTTHLREAARVLADELGKRVIVVDTSNEIGGGGDVPHPAIGSARRMQVARPDRQHAVMIEAVENHMPEVIVVDEIGTEAEAAAARTIAERGVQLIGTAHGNTLENLIMNPTLSDLDGGIHTVTLSDEEARRRSTPKTITERRAPPTFDIVVEMLGRNEHVVHADTALAIDRLLQGGDPSGERRVRSHDGTIERATSEGITAAQTPRRQASEQPVRIYGVRAQSGSSRSRDSRPACRGAQCPPRGGRGSIVALRSRTDDARLKRLLDATEAPLHRQKQHHRSASTPVAERLQRNARPG